MLDLAWIILWSALSFGVGFPAVRLLGKDVFRYRILVAPTAGYAVLAMVSTIAYTAGMSLHGVLVASLILSAGGWVWCLVDRMGEELEGSGAVMGFWILSLLVFLAPKWAAGYQFFAFQGNPWDTFAYLESALIYARDSYAAVRAMPPETHTFGLYQTASWNLWMRPSVHILYALFGQFDVGMMHRLHYTFLVFLISQCVPAMVFVVVNLFGASTRLAAVVAFAVTGGFWGQYIVDINSWSQASSMAIQLLMVGVVARALTESGSLAGFRPFALLLFLGTCSAAAAYLYPESFLFHLPAIAPMALLLVALSGERVRKLAVLAGAGGVLACWVYPCYAFTLGVGINQARWARESAVEWWKFFDAYLLGREMRAPAVGWPARAIDVLAGLEGLYFLTPGSSVGWGLRLGVRIGLLCLCVGMIAAAVKAFRATISQPGARPIAAGFLALLCVEVVIAGYLASQGLIWSAGKALSYASPHIMLFLLFPLLVARRAKLGMVALVPAMILLVAQIGFALSRPVVGMHANGIHFDLPYPSVNNAISKTGFRWNVDDILRDVSRLHCEAIIVDVKDEWLRRYLVVTFRALELPFVDERAAGCYVFTESRGTGGPAILVVERRGDG